MLFLPHISILFFFFKIFEKILLSRLNKFIKIYHILDDNQFGFRSRLCTTNALLELLAAAYNSLNGQSHMLALYLDFSKAFDTVNHESLLIKLVRPPWYLRNSQILVHQVLLNWSKSICITVCISGINSSKIPILSS